MRNKAPDNWRNAVAYEAEVQFATALIRIGERLAKEASIVRAPLPERMTALLNELRRRRKHLKLSGRGNMAHRIFTVVALASAAVLTATGYAFAGEQGASSGWKPPQVIGQPGYKEEAAKPREATAPRPISQDPHAARNPNAPTQNR